MKIDFLDFCNKNAVKGDFTVNTLEELNKLKNKDGNIIINGRLVISSKDDEERFVVDCNAHNINIICAKEIVFNSINFIGTSEDCYFFSFEFAGMMRNSLINNFEFPILNFL